MKNKATRYGIAAVIAAGSLLCRLALNPLLETRNPYVFAFLAVLFSARYLGIGPSIFVTVVTGLASAYLFAGRVTLLPHGIPSIGLDSFLLLGAAAIWLMEQQRRDNLRAEENSRMASERFSELLRATEEREREQGIAARLRAIVESSEDAIISKNLDGVIESWNKAAERIFGYTSEEMIGKTMAPLLPPDRTQEESEIIDRLHRGVRVKHFETLRLRKDGTKIPVFLTISPVYDESGRVVGASHIARDITEQKAMEEQLRQTQKLESLGVLAGGLAHDFNNLLTGIMGNASLALDETNQSGSLRSQLSEVLHAGERAAMLVRQMLAYAGKGRFVVEPLDLSQEILQIIALIPRGVKLELQLASNLPSIDADRSQIQQLVMNLVINAAEAVGDRPGSVTVITGQRETDQEKQVVLTVKDTGCGMDEATRAKMFDPFFTTKFTGRGLGLSAVVGIIRTHRGSISVDSAPGVGTTITVVLPAAASLTAVSVPDEHLELQGSGHILVIDDEELVRNLARFTLERCGYTTELASHGEAAVGAFAAQSSDFAAVLLDLTMPGMGGEELLFRLRQIRPDVPVVLSSGFSEVEALQRFTGSRLAGFLQKPYTATALARKMKQALRDAVPKQTI